MLLEFRVKNFRCLRDEQVLSMVASKDTTLQETNSTTTGLRAAPRALNSAAIYGANASGKSTVLMALQFMLMTVLLSTDLKPDSKLFVAPFRLDPASADQPTDFEASFMTGGIRYQYGFSCTADRIVSEFLLAYPAGRKQLWFERTYKPDEDAEHYTFGSALKGQKNVWKTSTRANALFLSTAVKLNSAQLRIPYQAIGGGCMVLNKLFPSESWNTAKEIQQNSLKQAVLSFLNAADISITDIFVQERKEEKNSASVQETGFVPSYDVSFLHTAPRGELWLRLMEESNGTQSLFSLLGPIIAILQVGGVLAVDELDASLHPLLVRKLVQLFQSPQTNPKGAQLIFAAHDTSLMTGGLLRRDQIWFVEKDAEQASHLYSLAEFSPRKDEAIERGYFQGRYGGLPLLTEGQRS